MPISLHHLQQIAQAIYPQGKLNDFKALTGGISAQTILLEIERSKHQMQRVVLRQHGEVDRKRTPHIARDEYRLLNVLQNAGLPVPQPIYVDDSNMITNIPYIVLEYVEHEPLDEMSIDADQIQQVAETLRDIHQVNLSAYDLSFLPDLMDSLKSRMTQPPTVETKRIHTALVHALPYLAPNRPTLLHGDYWLGNILWRKEKVVGIIDWEDAMIGDPLSDLGKSRLEILWAGGVDAMNTYTNHYFAIMPKLKMSSLPFWDLYGAVELAGFTMWFDDTDKINWMQEKYDWFVDSAIRQLS